MIIDHWHYDYYHDYTIALVKAQRGTRSRTRSVCKALGVVRACLALPQACCPKFIAHGVVALQLGIKTCQLLCLYLSCNYLRISCFRVSLLSAHVSTALDRPQLNCCAMLAAKKQEEPGSTQPERDEPVTASAVAEHAARSSINEDVPWRNWVHLLSTSIPLRGFTETYNLKSVFFPSGSAVSAWNDQQHGLCHRELVGEIVGCEVSHLYGLHYQSWIAGQIMLLWYQEEGMRFTGEKAGTLTKLAACVRTNVTGRSTVWLA